MKLHSISACLVVCLSLSLHAMEEREDGSKTPRANQQKSGAGVGRKKKIVNPHPQSLSEFSFASQSEENLEFLSSRRKKMTSPYAQQLAEEVADYLDQCEKDDTYKDIPTSERDAFMRDEIKWTQNPTCYYNRCKIYKIESAKIRYDLMKEHYRHKRNGRIGLAVLGGTTIAALLGMTYAGKAYFDANEKLDITQNTLTKVSRIAWKSVELNEICASISSLWGNFFQGKVDQATFIEQFTELSNKVTCLKESL